MGRLNPLDTAVFKLHTVGVVYFKKELFVPARVRVTFAEFKQAVRQSYKDYSKKKLPDKDDTRVQNEKDYFSAIALAAKNFRDDELGRTSQKKDKAWQDWFAVLKEELGDAWKAIEDTSASKINQMDRGTGNLLVAYAIHYRLHAEFYCPQFALDIDEKVFGGSFESTFHKPVFEDSSNSLPATFPKRLKLPKTYQFERDEYCCVKEALLEMKSQNLPFKGCVFGAGGYGKTSLAIELCGDEDVLDRFPGGIYWLEFGFRNDGVGSGPEQIFKAKDAVSGMLNVQYPRELHGLVNLAHGDVALESLIKALPNEPILLIADDLWSDEQLGDLLHQSDYVSILATTRVKVIKSRFSVSVEITRFSNSASYKLISDGMDDLTSEQQARVRAISDRFYGWPLLLQLANSTFKFQRDLDTPTENTLAEFEAFTTMGYIADWDRPEPGDTENDKRQKFIKYCIEAGLKALPDKAYRDCLFSLAVFPEDTDIPFSVISDYWTELTKHLVANKSISSIKASNIRNTLNNLSYFDHYDPVKETLRIHDVFHAYFRSLRKPKKWKKFHRCIIEVIKSRCSADLASLPVDQEYCWKNLGYHLKAAGSVETLEETLFSIRWLKAWHALRHDVEIDIFYSFAMEAGANPWISDAIQQSTWQNNAESFQSLLLQLFGRLSCNSRKDTQRFFASVMSEISSSNLPVIHTLRPANPNREFFYDDEYDVRDPVFGNIASIRDVCLSHDGGSAFWISGDGVLNVLEDTLDSTSKKIIESPKLVSLSLSKSGDELLVSNLNGYIAFGGIKKGCFEKMSGPQYRGISRASYFSSVDNSILLDSANSKTAIVNRFGEVLEEIDGALSVDSRYSTNVSEHNGVALINFVDAPKVWRSQSCNWDIEKWPSNRFLGKSDFSKCGSVAILSAYGQSTTWIIDATQRSDSIHLADHGSEISTVKICSSGLIAVIATWDGNVQLICIRSGQSIARRNFIQSVGCAIFTECGNFVLLSLKGKVSLVDLNLCDVGVDIFFDYVVQTFRLRNKTVFMADGLGREHIFQLNMLK